MSNKTRRYTRSNPARAPKEGTAGLGMRHTYATHGSAPDKSVATSQSAGTAPNRTAPKAAKHGSGGGGTAYNALGKGKMYDGTGGGTA